VPCDIECRSNIKVSATRDRFYAFCLMLVLSTNIKKVYFGNLPFSLACELLLYDTALDFSAAILLIHYT
jgi:hypothetical protein